MVVPLASGSAFQGVAMKQKLLQPAPGLPDSISLAALGNRILNGSSNVAWLFLHLITKDLGF